MENFENFEHEIMKTMLSGVKDRDMLIAQYRNASVLSRIFTGCGFYTNFVVEDESLCLKKNMNYELGCEGQLDGVKNGVGFVLFIRNGLISMLEGYTYNEAWPESINGYVLTKAQV